MDGLQIFVEEKLQTLILILHGYWVIFITSIFIFVTQLSQPTNVTWILKKIHSQSLVILKLGSSYG